MTIARVSAASPVKLAIADTNLMAGRLLSDHFDRHSGFAVVSWATDKASFLRSVRQITSDVAIISADLQDGLLSGLAALREVHQHDPNLRPILLVDRPEPQLVVEGLRA